MGSRERSGLPLKGRQQAQGCGSTGWPGSTVTSSAVYGPRPPVSGEALTALAAAAVTLRARVAPHVPAWTLIGQITHGRLLAPPARAGLRSRTCRVRTRPQPGATVTTPNPAGHALARGIVTTTPSL